MQHNSKASVSAYLESWGAELSARQNRVRQLIGSAHWLSDGHHKEAILGEFITRYLPRSIDCSTGFIRGVTATAECSPEVDILLFNRQLHLPYFSEGGISIVDPASVVATIEVKSSFSTTSIDDAVNNIRRVRQLTLPSKESSASLWSGVFFYDISESRTLESASETFAERLLQIHSEKNHSLLPTCAALGQNYVIFPRFESEKLRIRGFEAAGYSFASALCDLLGTISSTTEKGSLSGFDEWGVSTNFRLIDKIY